jgi:hypothetical protein
VVRGREQQCTCALHARPLARLVALANRRQGRETTDVSRWHPKLRGKPDIELLIEDTDLPDLEILTPATDQGIESLDDCGEALLVRGVDELAHPILKALDSLWSRGDSSVGEAKTQKLETQVLAIGDTCLVAMQSQL